MTGPPEASAAASNSAAGLNVPTKPDDSVMS
jgi:hypothetical protein